jgi:recombinational DNA repair protein RecR
VADDERADLNEHLQEETGPLEETIRIIWPSNHCAKCDTLTAAERCWFCNSRIGDAVPAL